MIMTVILWMLSYSMCIWNYSIFSSTHNSTMKELEEMKRKLSAKEQYCHSLEMKLAESAKKPLQDVDVNQQIPTKPSLAESAKKPLQDVDVNQQIPTKPSLAESAKKPLQDVDVNQQIPTKPSLVKTVEGSIRDPQEKSRLVYSNKH